MDWLIFFILIGSGLSSIFAARNYSVADHVVFKNRSAFLPMWFISIIPFGLMRAIYTAVGISFLAVAVGFIVKVIIGSR